MPKHAAPIHRQSWLSKQVRQTFPQADLFFLAQVKFFIVVIVIVSVLLAFFAVKNLTHKEWTSGSVEFILAGAIWMLLHALFTFRRPRRIYTYAAILTTLLMVFLLISGGDNKTGIYWIFIIPSCFFFIFGSRIGARWLLLTAGVLTTTFLLTQVEVVKLPYSSVQLRTIVLAYLFMTAISYVKIKFLEQVQSEVVRTALVSSRHERELVKYQMAVEEAFDHMVITDPKGIILYANPAVTKTTGYEPGEILGKTPSLWGGQMPKNFYANMWNILREKKQRFSGELTNVRKNGQHYVAEVNISPILNAWGDVQYYVGVERDITRAKEIDRAKTEFVSLASHQLRTPLSAINWYTEMLMNGDAGKVTEDQQVYLREVYAGSQRMVALVNALLNVSRIDMGSFAIEPEPTDIREVASIAVKELAHQLQNQKQKVVEDFDPNMEKANLDPKLLAIIFQNLLSNASKYSPQGATITLRIKTQANQFLIEIVDTGFGIPLQEQGKIFEKLFRAENVREKVTDGTGLGLYIVKAIVEKSGGSISFTSAEGRGTTFRVILPRRGMTPKQGAKGLTTNT